MSEPSALTGAIVLVVDDHPGNLDILVSTFSAAGSRVLVKTEGAAAIEVAARVKPDIILMDILMPGLDGFEVCRLLKQDERTADIPLIFTSRCPRRWTRSPASERAAWTTSPSRSMLRRCGPA